MIEPIVLAQLGATLQLTLPSKILEKKYCHKSKEPRKRIQSFKVCPCIILAVPLWS